MIFEYFKNKKLKKEQKLEEEYQIVLKDWELSISNINTAKPIRSIIIECMKVTKLIFASKEQNIEDNAKWIKNHPRKFHWHIPTNIRKLDFLKFVDISNKDLLKKLKHRYEGYRK